MSAAVVVVVRTGTANLASVLAGLRRAELRPVASDDPEQIVRAERLVLPGVGAFGAAMERLGRVGLVEPLRGHVRAGRPLLAICLGLQLLAESSEESRGVAGLGLLPGRATRFPVGVLVPQIGWNRVSPVGNSELLQAGHAYFANSYRLSEVPPGWSGATCEHGGDFVAALERGNLLGCQFHPELSGRWGLELIRRWAAISVTGGARC